MPHAIHFRAKCGADLVTQPSTIRGNETLELHRVDRRICERLNVAIQYHVGIIFNCPMRVWGVGFKYDDLIPCGFGVWGSWIGVWGMGSSRHVVQYVAQCVACAALMLAVGQ